MAEVTFSNAAEGDLVEIDKYSASQFGEGTAYEYMHGFDEAFALLRDFPEAGRSVPELRGDIRCLVRRRHRIFYTFDGVSIFVVRIVHHAIDPKRALKGERSDDRS